MNELFGLYWLVWVDLQQQRQYSVTQALTVNGRKIPPGITRYETQINGQPVLPPVHTRACPPNEAARLTGRLRL